MNRETSIHSSDTLVVVDRSRRRRRMVILGALAAMALLIIAIAFLTSRGSSGGEAGPAAAGGAGAGQIPTVTVVVPGRSQVGRVILRAAHSAPAATSRSGSLAKRPHHPGPRRRRKAGSARARCSQLSTGRCRRSRPRSRLRSRQREPTLPLRNRTMSAPLRSRAVASCQSRRSTPRKLLATLPMRRCVSRRHSSERLEREIGQLDVRAPTCRADSRAQRRARTDRQPGFGDLSALPKAARWKCRRSSPSRTSR